MHHFGFPLPSQNPNNLFSQQGLENSELRPGTYVSSDTGLLTLNQPEEFNHVKKLFFFNFYFYSNFLTHFFLFWGAVQQFLPFCAHQQSQREKIGEGEQVNDKQQSPIEGKKETEKKNIHTHKTYLKIILLFHSLPLKKVFLFSLLLFSIFKEKKKCFIFSHFHIHPFFLSSF